MMLAWSRRRAAIALAGLAVAGASPARAYDDKSTIGSVMELVGVSSDPSSAKIDYGERPKLVLPPRANGLPAPREDAARPDGWPTDAAAARRRNTDRFERIANAPPPETRTNLLERIRGPKPAYAPGTDDEPGFLQKALKLGGGNEAPVMDEPARRMLSEPPSGYRRPTVDLATVKDTDGRKSGWWPMSLLGGGGNDADPVAQPGARTPAQQRAGQARASGGESQSWFQMPRFLQGSND
jgi:hypothetical protein